MSSKLKIVSENEILDARGVISNKVHRTPVVHSTYLGELAHTFDSSHKSQSRYKTKTSGKKQRPARDRLIIDRESRKTIHRVWEQDEDGNWELVHDEENPFP